MKIEPHIELRVLLSELERRANSSAVSSKDSTIRDESFKDQDAFVLDRSRSVAALCTRRAGKTNGLALRFFRTMQKYPGSFCPYIALTRESAKNIMWPVLQEMNERFKLGGEFTESNLTLTMPNGSRLQLFGADMKNFINRLKGIKTPGAGVDELQAFGPHVEQLVNDVLEPATLDYPDGWIALTGTPGPVPRGFFYEVTEEKRHGYSLHTWGLFDNPYLPDARRFVDELKTKKGWPNDNPTLLREYYGRWVLDLDALVIRYTSKNNHYIERPAQTRGDWQYVIGIDIGYDDADAIAVIGWHKHLKAAYLVEEVINREQGITELAAQIEQLIQVYQPDKVVMDAGGLGKKIAEEMRRRFSLPIVPAEKSRKVEYIEILNDALRTKSFFAKESSQFVEDSLKLKWDFEKSTPDKMVIDTGFHSDIIDAVLYAFRESMHWISEPEVVKPVTGSNAWLQQQAEEHERLLESQINNSQQDPWSQNVEWEWGE